MNFAYLHLAINHIPVIGIPVTFAFLVYGVRTRNLEFQRFSLLILAALAAVVLPVYLTGEPAEEFVEHLAGFSHDAIEAHEDFGKYAMSLTLLTGACALAALFVRKNLSVMQFLVKSTLVLAVFAMLSLFYTATLGGSIRHTEFTEQR